MKTNIDFLVIGAGVVGLTIARELKMRQPQASITILEKESMVGLHSSGRNSGVLHSGIYYPTGSFKARVCSIGAREMAEFCIEHGLPLKRIGKILIPTRAEDNAQLSILENRARANGIEVRRLDEKELREMEPEVRSATGKGLWVPSTSVASPVRVIEAILNEITKLGVDIRYSARIASINVQSNEISLMSGDQISFGHAINAAGLHADVVAHQFGVGQRYTLLPFKGIYWKLDPEACFDIRHLIYPVPDLRVPFLGVHTTTTTDGVTYLGPTAVPALGRENYHGFDDVNIRELSHIVLLLARQFWANQDGFRRLAWQEGRRYFQPWFIRAAQAILPRLEPKHLLPANKVGIRAQMVDQESGRLVTDFLVERGRRSTHILNAISPAWTSSFPLARMICDQYIFREQDVPLEQGTVA